MRIEGQIRAIRSMIHSGKSYKEIDTQLRAIFSAVRALRVNLFLNEIKKKENSELFSFLEEFLKKEK